MREEQKQEVVLEARRGYRFVISPSLLVCGALPSSAPYFLVREFATPRPEPPIPPATEARPKPSDLIE